jgi:hypothetical protein
MASDVVAFRFPDGTQFRTLSKLPEVGEALRSEGQSWTVIDVGTNVHGDVVVTLEPAAESSGPSVGEPHLR